MARYACIEKCAPACLQSLKTAGSRTSLNCRKACEQQCKGAPGLLDSAAAPEECSNTPAGIAGARKLPEEILRWRLCPDRSQSTFDQRGAAVNHFTGGLAIQNAIAANDGIELYRD